MNVYFIQRGPSGPIKIGFAKNPIERLKSLQVASPEKLHLIGCVRGEEKEIHSKFAAHRISGEWFSPHKTIISFIAKNSRRLPRSYVRRSVRTRITQKQAMRLELERQRRSRVAGVNLSTNAVIGQLIEEELDRDGA